MQNSTKNFWFYVIPVFVIVIAILITIIVDEPTTVKTYHPYDISLHLYKYESEIDNRGIIIATILVYWRISRTVSLPYSAMPMYWMTSTVLFLVIVIFILLIRRIDVENRVFKYLTKIIRFACYIVVIVSIIKGFTALFPSTRIHELVSVALSSHVYTLVVPIATVISLYPIWISIHAPSSTILKHKSLTFHNFSFMLLVAFIVEHLQIVIQTLKFFPFFEYHVSFQHLAHILLYSMVGVVTLQSILFLFITLHLWNSQKTALEEAISNKVKLKERNIGRLYIESRLLFFDTFFFGLLSGFFIYAELIKIVIEKIIGIKGITTFRLNLIENKLKPELRMGQILIVLYPFGLLTFMISRDLDDPMNSVALLIIGVLLFFIVYAQPSRTKVNYRRRLIFVAMVTIVVLLIIPNTLGSFVNKTFEKIHYAFLLGYCVIVVHFYLSFDDFITPLHRSCYEDRIKLLRKEVISMAIILVILNSFISSEDVGGIFSTEQVWIIVSIWGIVLGIIMYNKEKKNLEKFYNIE